MMKRLIAAVCAVVMTLSLCACGSTSFDDEFIAKYKDSMEKPEYEALDFVKLSDGYKNLKFEMEPEYKITEKDIDEMTFNYILQGVGHIQKRNHPVKDDSILEISYTAEIDGNFEKRLSSSGHRVLDMKDNTVPPEFVEALRTMKTGESTHIIIEFDDTYPAVEFKNKTVDYTLTLHYVLYNPEVTDENVKIASQGTLQSVDELREQVRENGETYYSDKYYSELTMSVVNALKDCASIDSLPKDLEEWYVHTIMHDSYMMAAQNGMSFSGYVQQTTQMNIDNYEKHLYETAVDDLYVEVVLKAVSEKENLTITDEIYQKYASKLAALNKFDSIEAMEKAVPESVIHENVFLEMVMGWLIDHATVTYSAIEESTGE